MKNFLPIFYFFCVAIQAQVGIGTTTPQATLDITGQPTISTELDGVIAPRLTGNQLRAKTYTAAQTAAMVYVTAPDSAPAGQTINVTAIGYYYFDGTVWGAVAPNTVDWQTNGNSDINDTTHFLGTTTDQDIIFKRNNVQSGWLEGTNTSFGVNSLPTSATGEHNTAIGRSVLANNTSGNRNTAIGSYTMASNTTGQWNTAMGRYTMFANTSGSNNMALGQEAARWNSSGNDNVAIGYSALKNNDTGSFNVAIGRSAMATGPNVASTYGNNNIAIGYNAQLPTVTTSNQMVLGNISISPANSNSAGIQGEIRVVGSYLYIYCSDNRWRRASLSTF